MIYILQCVSPLFPFQPFCGSHAFSHKHFCSVAFVSDKWSAASSVIKYSCICFADRQAESAHTFSFQKILSNLVKNIFCPAKSLFLILRLTLNFKIICAQSESLICHSYAHCGSNLAQLICCSSSITIPNHQWVSDLIYTLDPWPLTEPDRFQSTKTHVSMPCPPPSHISTAQHSFLIFYALTSSAFKH